MYNLNINMAATAANAVSNLLAVESGGTTPRTPEILNSLIAMSNPMDNYHFGDDAPKSSSKPFTTMSSDSNSSSCSQTESPTNGVNSVQQTCSQLIKAGLKLSIEQKRKYQCDSEDLLDLDKCCKRIKKNECSESEEDKVNNTGLTPEDEERRRRRRERNKIAATKCRLKKRERTANLVTESEILENQNVDLKQQIQELKREKRHLLETLNLHQRSCQKNIPPVTRDSIFSQRLPPVSSVIDNHSYSRPASVVTNFRTQSLEVFNRPASVGSETYSTRCTTLYYTKPPSILVEPPPTENYQPSQITNLDNSVQNSYHYNNQQCHNYSSNQNYGNPGMDNGCMA